nr:probable protein disulfide-isomerase A4 isoform X1 [Hydra vulgaris]
MYLHFLLTTICVGVVASKINTKYIMSVDDIKEYKKILKTHKNLLTVYSSDDKSAVKTLKWLDNVSKEIKGKGSIIHINCGENKETKKLCKKYEVNPQPIKLRHYKDGNFNKDYDRQENEKSMVSFMMDPTGDAPWEEDQSAQNVVHINNEKDLNKLRKKEKGQLLIMFYAPWCGFCKKLKPEYAGAADEMKNKAVLAAMDVDKPDVYNVRYQFNITGYPTIIYFEDGNEKFRYSGKMDKEGIVTWLADPKPVSKEEQGDDWEAPEITHLNNDNFDSTLKTSVSTMVMFYAPWCGYCKKMKPEYVNAAITLQAENVIATLAAVDCTQSQATCNKFEVKSYPTIKYFINGTLMYGLNTYKADDIVAFMKDPKEPPPPPPADLPWAETSGSEILHLSNENFKDEMKTRKHTLVMFYAPWCGHCKKAKPEIEAAAEYFKDDRKITFAGVDCTVHDALCKSYEVSGYPTFRYFLYGKKDFVYKGGNTKENFIAFMKNPEEPIIEKSRPVEPEWSETNTNVVHLNFNTFDNFISKNPSALVMFYAPWCGHCKALKPAYTEAAEELLYKNHKLCAVDCTKNQDLCNEHNVTGYPTIKHFYNGKVSHYNGGRSKEDIITFLSSIKTEKKVPTTKNEFWDSNDVIHLDDVTFPDFIKETKIVLIMFYAPWCGHCNKMKSDYQNVANIFHSQKILKERIAAIDCVVNRATCIKYDVHGYPTLKLFKDGEKYADYEGGRTSSQIVEFVKNSRHSTPPVQSWSNENTAVIHLNDDTFDSFIAEYSSVLVMFYAPWCGHCKSMKPAYEKAAEYVNLKEEVPGKLAAFDCTVNKVVPKALALQGYPTLMYFKNGHQLEKYEGDRSFESIVDYMKKASEKKEGPSAVKEWKDEPSAVHHITQNSFEEFILEKDVLIMFYAPWCSHCNGMKPAFMQAANTLKKENFPGVLAAVDATKAVELANKEGVKAYPTLRYYSKGEFIEQFTDDRSVENIIRFMKKQKESPHRRQASIDNFDWSDMPSQVTHLSADGFQSFLNGKTHALVMFYVKWCNGCFEMRGSVMQAASRLSTQPLYAFAAINCDENDVFCSSIGVVVFPSIKYYSKGEFVENYEGIVKPETIVNYLKSKVKDEL